MPYVTEELLLTEGLAILKEVCTIFDIGAGSLDIQKLEGELLKKRHEVEKKASAPSKRARASPDVLTYETDSVHSR
jgi:hypothetical protein